MTILIIIFGGLILLVGLVITFNPEIVFGYIRKHYEKTSLHILAGVIRILLGVLFIWQANVSKFPLTMEILGWLSIIAGLSLGVIGRKHFIRLISWALTLSKNIGRIGGVIAALFGAFLIYAFI
jgi:hypothetical protein